MEYTPLCIKAYGDRTNPALYPQIDEEGRFLLEPGDGAVDSAKFTNLQLRQGSRLVYESEHALNGALFMTDSRVILLCKDYDSGGALWIGNPVITVIASVASAALAKARTAHTVLTGHVRYEWIEHIAPSSDSLLFGLADESITLTYRDPLGARWSLAIALEHARGVADKVDATIRRHREQKGSLSGQTKKAIELPEHLPEHLSEYLYCTQCGKRVKASDAYCKHCGVRR